jgi:hypothetical protein
MRWRSRILGLLVAVAVGVVAVGGCQEERQKVKAPKRFCDAAVHFEDRLQRGAKLDEQIRLVRKLVDTAPAKIKADTETFLHALERVRTDPSVKDNKKIEKAVDRVNGYAFDGCALDKPLPGTPPA